MSSSPASSCVGSARPRFTCVARSYRPSTVAPTSNDDAHAGRGRTAAVDAIDVVVVVVVVVVAVVVVVDRPCCDDPLGSWVRPLSDRLMEEERSRSEEDEAVEEEVEEEEETSDAPLAARLKMGAVVVLADPHPPTFRGPANGRKAANRGLDPRTSFRGGRAVVVVVAVAAVAVVAVVSEAAAAAAVEETVDTVETTAAV